MSAGIVHESIILLLRSNNSYSNQGVFTFIEIRIHRTFRNQFGFLPTDNRKFERGWRVFPVFETRRKKKKKKREEMRARKKNKILQNFFPIQPLDFWVCEFFFFFFCSFC
jgi:hypothetical protein